jgi:hypothetical protein
MNATVASFDSGLFRVVLTNAIRAVAFVTVGAAVVHWVGSQFIFWPFMAFVAFAMLQHVFVLLSGLFSLVGSLVFPEPRVGRGWLVAIILVRAAELGIGIWLVLWLWSPFGPTPTLAM